jgi:hypothetical protein
MSSAQVTLFWETDIIPFSCLIRLHSFEKDTSSHNIVLPYLILPIEAPLTMLTFGPLESRVVAWTYVALHP